MELGIAPFSINFNDIVSKKKLSKEKVSETQFSISIDRMIAASVRAQLSADLDIEISLITGNVLRFGKESQDSKVDLLQQHNWYGFRLRDDVNNYENPQNNDRFQILLEESSLVSTNEIFGERIGFEIVDEHFTELTWRLELNDEEDEAKRQELVNRPRYKVSPA